MNEDIQPDYEPDLDQDLDEGKEGEEDDLDTEGEGDNEEEGLKDDPEGDEEGGEDPKDPEEDLEEDDVDYHDDEALAEKIADEIAEKYSDEEIQNFSAEQIEVALQGGDPYAYGLGKTLTYKVNGMENNFPDWASGLVTDEKTEQQFREILEKQGAFDHVKQQRDNYKTSFDEYNQVKDTLKNVAHFARQGDLDSVLDLVGIDKKTIEDWKARNDQLSDLTFEERQAYDQNSELNRQNYLLQRQLEQQNERIANQAVEQRYAELDSHIMNHPEREAIQSYNQNYGGNPDAFRNSVIAYGQAYVENNNRDISVAEATNHVLQFYTGTPAYQNQVQGNQGNVSQIRPKANSKPRVKKELPTIPTVPRSSKSAVKSQISSIEDLKKRALQLS